MGTIDDYLGTLDASDRDVVAHVYDVARAALGDTEQGTSYGMPALMWHGKAVLSVMRTKKHIGVYPFSGRVVETLGDALEGIDAEKGTIRFMPEAPLSDDLVRLIVAARRAEIDDPSLRRRARD